MKIKIQIEDKHKIIEINNFDDFIENRLSKIKTDYIINIYIGDFLYCKYIDNKIIHTFDDIHNQIAKDNFYSYLINKKCYHQSDIANKKSINFFGLKNKFNYFSLDYDEVPFLDAEEINIYELCIDENLTIFPDTEVMDINGTGIFPSIHISELYNTFSNLDFLYSIYYEYDLLDSLDWIVIAEKIPSKKLKLIY